MDVSKLSKFVFVTFALLMSPRSEAQNGLGVGDVSKSLKSCVRPGAASRLKVGQDGKLQCDEKGNILWIEEVENVADKNNSVHENASIQDINRVFGTVILSKQATVDHRQIAKNSDLEKDARENGDDILIDTFVIDQTKAKVVEKDKNNNLVAKDFVDSESNLTKEGSKSTDSDDTGDDSKVNASEYSFYPFIMFDDGNAKSSTQAILPGTVVCSKPKRLTGFDWIDIGMLSSVGRKQRVYVENNIPAQYCYADTLGIELPSGFKNGESKLGMKIILPYSQKGPNGEDSGLVATWPSITKAQYDSARYILLTAGKNPATKLPRIVIGLTKVPVKLGR